MSYLLCARVKDMTFVPSVAVFEKCPLCGERVALAPASVAIHQSGIPIVCNVCVKNVGPTLPVMTTGQLQDLATYEREEKAQRN